MSVIVFDLDDILVPFVEPFIDWHNQEYGTRLVYENITSFDLWIPLKLEQEELIRRVGIFENTAGFRQQRPYSDMCDIVAESSRKYTQKHVVTARVHALHEFTNYQIRSHFPSLFSGVHLTNGLGNRGQSRKKDDVCLELGADVIVEDNSRTVNACQERGIQAIVVSRPWNINAELCSGVLRAESNEELRKLL